MRSELIFGALTHVSNRYQLCQLASKATRKLHKPNSRLHHYRVEEIDQAASMNLLPSRIEAVPHYSDLSLLQEAKTRLDKK